LAATAGEHALDLPPGYREVGLRELGDAFAKAIEIAPAAGAGTLVWVRRFDLVEAAVVLEPAEPLSSARRAFFAGMNAAADALAAYCPPEKPITFAWPDTILLDGGLIGGGRLAWPEDATEAEPPAWLVFGLLLRSTVHAARRPDMAHKDRTTLEDEGFEVLDARDLIASFSRHLMVHLDRWQADGFAQVGADYLSRLTPEGGPRRAINGSGDLLLHGRPGAMERRSLVEGLAKCEWLDPESREPWL
jgi:biotin-(acetyl-CoA carboxylase) ligase